MGEAAGTLEVLNDRGDVEAVVECTPPPQVDCLFDGLNDALANARLAPFPPLDPDVVITIEHDDELTDRAGGFHASTDVVVWDIPRRPVLTLEVEPVDRLAAEIPWLPRWRKHRWRVNPATVRQLRRWVALKPAGWFTVGEAAELAELNVAVPASKIGER